MTAVFPGGQDSFVHSDMIAFLASCTAENSAIEAVRQQHPQFSTATILRHLKHCNNNVNKTIAHLESCNTWRQMMFPMTALSEYSLSSRNRSAAPSKHGLIYAHGVDFFGHPLLIFNSFMNDPKTRNIDELVHLALYMLEVTMSRLSPTMMHITCFINRTDSKFALDTEFCRRFLKLLSQYYPERVFRMIVYPVPTALRVGWNLLKHMARRPLKKLVLAQNLTKLREYIPDEYIPSEIGGSCTYKFNVRDYPSPHVESLLCRGGEPLYAGTENNTNTEVQVNVEDLLVDKNCDDYAGRSINQASVGAAFFRNRRVYCAGSDDSGSSLGPSFGSLPSISHAGSGSESSREANTDSEAAAAELLTASVLVDVNATVATVDEQPALRQQVIDPSLTCLESKSMASLRPESDNTVCNTNHNSSNPNSSKSSPSNVDSSKQGSSSKSSTGSSVDAQAVNVDVLTLSFDRDYSRHTDSRSGGSGNNSSVLAEDKMISITNTTVITGTAMITQVDSTKDIKINSVGIHDSDADADGDVVRGTDVDVGGCLLTVDTFDCAKYGGGMLPTVSTINCTYDASMATGDSMSMQGSYPLSYRG